MSGGAVLAFASVESLPQKRLAPSNSNAWPGERVVCFRCSRAGLATQFSHPLSAAGVVRTCLRRVNELLREVPSPTWVVCNAMVMTMFARDSAMTLAMRQQQLSDSTLIDAITSGHGRPLPSACTCTCSASARAAVVGSRAPMVLRVTLRVSASGAAACNDMLG